MGVPVKKTAKGKKPSKPAAPRQLSAEDHFLEAEMAYFADDFPAARASFQRALDLEPENAEFLDGYGAFLAECGPRGEAAAVLRRACQLDPDAGFEKFMYLGQVLDAEGRAEEAEGAVRRGVAILRAELGAVEAAGDDAPAGPDSDSEGGSGGAGGREALREALCSALCSLSELLMGAAADAADEADGEGGAEAALAASPALGECEELLGEARALCGASPEPLQALCSLRRLQGRDEEALQALRQSMALWFQPDSSDEEDEDEEEGGGDGGAHGRREPAEPAQQPAPPHAQGAPAAEAAAAEAAGSAEGSEQGGSQSEEEEEEMDLDPGAPLPSYEFRFECAKLLIELDDSTDAAAQVLEGLLEENDGVPEVWLLLAVAHRASGALAAAAATAEEGCALVRKLGVPAGDEVAAALAELVAEVAAEAGEAGPPAGGGDRK